MLIAYDPDEYEAVLETVTCLFHQSNPGKAYAGCTCSVSMVQRRRSADEITEIRAQKRRQEEDRILAEADAIRKRRAEGA